MKRFTFLIADDDNDDTELVREALENIDPQIEFFSASDGEQVLRILERCDSRPDVIFLDINMPVMNGWECLHVLKENERYRDIPVFIYSTSTLAVDLNKALESKASGFISKPANFKEIQNILQGVYDRIRHGSLDKVSEVRGVITG